MLTNGVNRVLSSLGLVSKRASSNNEAPDKKKVPFYKFEGIGLGKGHKIRTGIALGILGALIGTVYKYPEFYHDRFLEIAGTFDPQGLDDSRIYLSSYDNPKLASAENKYAAITLEANQNTDKHLTNFPEIISTYFENSNAASELKEEFLKVYNEQVNLQEARRRLNEHNISPESILNTSLTSQSESQNLKRDAFIAYNEALTDAMTNCYPIVGRAYAPAKLKLSNEVYDVLKNWESNYDNLFKPASESQTDINNFRKCKETFKADMDNIRYVNGLFAKYNVTPEIMLGKDFSANPKKPTHDEAKEIFAQMGFEISVDEIKRLAELDIRGSMSMSQEPSMEAMMAMKIQAFLSQDIRLMHFDSYASTVLNTFYNIVSINHEHLAKSEAVYKQKLEKDAAFRKEHGHGMYLDLGQDEITLQAIREQVEINKPYWQAIKANRQIIPDSLRVTQEGYNELTNANRGSYDAKCRDSLADFTKALAADTYRVQFEGYWLKNHFDASNEGYTLPMDGFMYNLAKR